jgi:NADH-quinone oxidoreductase subunit E
MKQHSELELSKIQNILDYYKDSFLPLDQQTLITCLKEIQAEFNYVPMECYPGLISLFNTSPQIIKSIIHRVPSLIEEGGPHLLLMCSGERCKDKGSYQFIQDVEEYLGCKVGGVSKDGLFELKTQSCLRRCALGKNLNIDTTPYTEMNFDKLKSILENIRKNK